MVQTADGVPSTTALAAGIRARLESDAPDLLGRFPLDGYIGAFDTLRDYGGYGVLPVAVEHACAEIQNQYGPDVLEDYHRLVLLALIERVQTTAPARRYPDSVLSLFHRYLRGVIAQIERKLPGFHLHENDRFSKDMAVCRQKLVPCGAQLVDVRSGVPRSSLWKGGVRQAVLLSWFVARRLGGFRPLYQLHMDPRLVTEFHPAGWEQCYRRIAELLEGDPNVLGVFGASWWFDPELEWVSPRLSFLRTLPESNGARVFRLGESDAMTGNALANSKQRQELYADGRYRPAAYLLIWGRQDLIAWSRGENDQWRSR